MKNDIKIAVYFKNREKPVILTDSVTAEDTYDNKVEFFHKLLSSENKILTVDFLKDNFIFNASDVQSIVISKPELNPDTDLIVNDDNDMDMTRDEIDESKPLDLGKNEDEDNIDDLDADAEDSKSIEIVD